MLSVVIVNYNGVNDTLECLASIVGKWDHECRIVVVDNGSIPPNDQEIRSAFPSITVLRSEQNLGWSGGNNLGAVESIRQGAKWIFLLNNDVVLRENWFRSIASVISTDSWDIFGPVILDFLPPHGVQTEGVNFNRVRKPIFERVRVPVVENPTDGGEIHVSECDIVNGCAMIIRADLFDRLGGIDDRFFLIAEESDFCIRAGDHGARIGVMDRALVLHKHSVTFKKAGRPVQLYYDTRNLGLLLWKHPTGRNRNTRRVTWWNYVKSVYYSYSRELEYSNPAGARAVAEGFVDFLLGRFGRKQSVRPTVTMLCERFLRFLTVLAKFR